MMMFKRLHSKFVHILNESERADWGQLAISVFQHKGAATQSFTLYNPKAVMEHLLAPGKDVTGVNGLALYLVQEAAIVGYIRMWTREQEGRPCMGAAEIIRSVIHEKYQGAGYGKMLYRLAMEIVKPQPIMPDRHEVSDKAIRVWKSLEKDSNIEKLPPNRKPYMGVFDDYRDPETTPEDDDCEIQRDDPEYNAATPTGLDPVPAINKAYKNKSSVGSLLQQLHANDLEFRVMVRDNAEKIKYHNLVDERWFDRLGSELFTHMP